jgi:hypothetical protein
VKTISNPTMFIDVPSKCTHYFMRATARVR